MLVTPASVAATVVVIVGGSIVWSNPGRRVNWAVFACSVHIAMWLSCLHVAVVVPAGEGLPWLRASCAVGGMIPFTFWMVKESVVGDGPSSWAASLWKQAPWLAVCGLLAVLPFTNFFIPAHSTAANRAFGTGYHVYIWSLLALYAYMFFEAFRTGKSLLGAPRLELQIWLGGGCAMVSSVIITMALNAATGDRIYIRMQPLVVLIFYTGIGLAITTHRIFDARQIVLVGIERSLLVAAVAGVAYGLDRLLGMVLPGPVAWVAVTALALWLAAVSSNWLDHLFHFYPQATAARQAAFAVTRNETRIENLENAFVDILRGWGHSGHAVVSAGAKGSLRLGSVNLAEDCPAIVALRQLRWATPERLSRERSTPDRQTLAKLLSDQSLGALVIGEGPSLTALVGVGPTASRRPFTYPQVTQLMELASIIESALERAHFSVKAQHAEQLATVGLLGASMAHEIRNPLVTIKTFVQLLPKHYQDPIFREKFFTLIGDEVTRIDRLTEQLLDLASPRAYQAQKIELHPVLRASVELVAAKAVDKHIEFLTELSAAPDHVLTDGSAAKQVLLNLCLNAIQAVEKQEGPRWVKVSTQNVGNYVEMTVEDSGPGIASEIRPRLFQPFQSTKSSGFGLGLAICSDILAGLDATITVDPLQPGRGATFRILFPCPAS